MIKETLISQFQNRETPFYFYDMDILRKTISKIKAANTYGFHVHYAIKANANKEILTCLFDAGFGADCVSGNEISKAIQMGVQPSKIAFAGVGKTDKEIITALEAGIFSFNCESLPELQVIDELAGKLNKTAPVAIRINPNVDPKTHKFITTGLTENKFGFNHQDLTKLAALLKSLKNIQLTGIHFHIGSQITDIEVFKELSLKVNAFSDWFEEQGLKLEHINMGGGLGIDYQNPETNTFADFEAYFAAFHKHLKLKQGQELHVELGRSVVAQCGHLITRVLYLKEGQSKNFLITDAGMTELIRPMLYQAYHAISNLTSKQEEHAYDIVGPICESTDVFATNLWLSEAKRGDLLAIHSAGAYGEVMASQYNLRDLVTSCTSDNFRS
ncbi:diaminopimelate decarboxylase [Mangrovibacterium lignilyticum]|uniref:diaminopimelate decarboxylase n=1 Tax=Mangrovibacterium lignilyticum TaxID=2668052 RepID=UPI0013CFD4B5|nr:diaminopimelate decarboxylase [Mangrovibacterium lignilyticum]